MSLNVKREGNKVTITVELFTQPYTSSTGKSTILYTSKGYQWIENMGINLTIIKSKKQPQQQ
jgi:hypothetical protein